MPYEIHLRSPNTTVAEDVAVKTAFDIIVVALQAASQHKVDAGGTMIGGKRISADEASKNIPFGQAW